MTDFSSRVSRRRYRIIWTSEGSSLGVRALFTHKKSLITVYYGRSWTGAGSLKPSALAKVFWMHAA